MFHHVRVNVDVHVYAHAVDSDVFMFCSKFRCTDDMKRRRDRQTIQNSNRNHPFHIQTEVAVFPMRWELFQLGLPQLILSRIRRAPCTVTGVDHQEGRKLGRKSSWFARAWICDDVELKSKSVSAPFLPRGRDLLRLVGLYSDETVTVHRNHGKPPVLTLLERALAVSWPILDDFNGVSCARKQIQYQGGYGMKPELCKPKQFYSDFVSERRHQASHHDLIILTHHNYFMTSPCSTICLCQH